MFEESGLLKTLQNTYENEHFDTSRGSWVDQFVYEISEHLDTQTSINPKADFASI